MTLERNASSIPAPPETQTIQLGRMRLTLDDLDDVLERLRIAGKEPLLIAGDAVASEALALKSATRAELARVAIRTADGSVDFKLWRGEAVATYNTSGKSTVRLVRGVTKLLTARHEPWVIQWLACCAMFFISGVIGLPALVGLSVLTGDGEVAKWLESAPGPEVPVIALFLVCFLVALFSGTLYYLIDRGESSGARILPFFRHERREVTFSARQAWLVGIATAVLSGVVGSVTTWVITR